MDFKKVINLGKKYHFLGHDPWERKLPLPITFKGVLYNRKFMHKIEVLKGRAKVT